MPPATRRSSPRRKSAQAEGPRALPPARSGATMRRIVEAMKRLQDGAIGDVVAIRALLEPGRALEQAARGRAGPTWSTSCATGSTYTWLSGDHIVEQHVHNIDVGNWGMGGIPVRVFGVGGRQARTAPEYGHIFDHFGLDYEYANGVRMHEHVPPAARARRGWSPRPSSGTKGTMRHAGRPPLRDQRPERVEVVGRVHEPVPAGAHGPDREHSGWQAAQRAEAGSRQHAHRDLWTGVGVHRESGRIRSVRRDSREPRAIKAGIRSGANAARCGPGDRHGDDVGRPDAEGCRPGWRAGGAGGCRPAPSPGPAL